MKKAKTIHDQRYRDLIVSLTEERVRLGISQIEFAEQVGLSQSDISKIEKLERRLDVLEFTLALGALRISTNTKLREIVTQFVGLPK